ncbi:hypothetical protein [Mesorhizobium sp. 128a]
MLHLIRRGWLGSQVAALSPAAGGGPVGPLLAWADVGLDSYGVGETEYTSSDILDLTGGPSGGGAVIVPGQWLAHPGGAGPKSFEFKTLFSDVVIGHEVILVVTFYVATGDTAQTKIAGISAGGGNNFSIGAADSSGVEGSVFDDNGPDSVDFSGGSLDAELKVATDYTAVSYRASYNGGSIGSGTMGSPEVLLDGTLAGRFGGAASPKIVSVYVYEYGGDLQALSTP